MAWLRNMAAGLRALFQRERVEREMDEELRGFLDASTEAKKRAGMAPDEAAYAARVEMGSTNAVKHRIRSAGWETAAGNLWQDLRYSVRMLAKSPGFTLVAVLSLALGIGANTAIFSLMEVVMLRSLPVDEPGQLVLFGDGRAAGSNDSLPNDNSRLFSYPFYRSFSQKNEVFSGVTAIDSIEFGTHATLAGGGREMLHASLVSGTYFSVLGVNPNRGRVLTEADDQTPGSGTVAVASYSWWLRHGNDPATVGKTVHIEGTDYTIVGIAPQGFFGVTVGESPDFWIPLSMEKEISPGWNGVDRKWFQSLYLVARLKPGVTVNQASANTNLLFKQYIRTEYLGQSPSQKDLADAEHAYIELTSAARGLSRLRRQFSLPLEILITIAGLVLLIACANLASLLLARGTSRSREFAMRMAIGATRPRIIRQLLTESFELALLGAVLGVASAWKAGHLLLTMASHSTEVAAMNVSPNLRVLGFTLALTIFTALLFGVTPAIRATRLDLTRSLKQGRGIAAPASRISLARALIVAQIALSLVLLAGASLFLRSLVNLTKVDTGFNKQNVLVLSLDEYTAGLLLDARLVTLQKQIEDRVQMLPGVHAASFSMFTFNQGMWSNDLTMQGIPRTPENSHDVLYNVVGDGFFSTMSLPIVAGRGFDERDKIDSPQVAVINQTMAHMFFPNSSPIGHHFGLGDDPSHSADIEIIGVVKNAKYHALDESPETAAYFPYSQRVQYFGNFSVCYSGDAGQIIPAVRHAIAEVNPNVLVGSISSLTEQVEESTSNQRLVARLSSFFSVLAAFLVCIGIYGLLSYSVARRTSEIGVRMALGAKRSNVLWLILREILVLVAIGIAIGVPVALAGNRLAAKLLYGLSPADPATLLAAIAMLIAIAVLAGYLPARKASLVEPTVALRCE
ncbi:MAG TPA: ABC transporter permease [Terracidiphilus sp.]